MAAVITPFRDEEMDPGSLEENLRYHDACGLDGVLIAGTTGENQVLTAEERDRAVSIAVDVLEKEVVVLAGVLRRLERPELIAADLERIARHGAHAALLAPPPSLEAPERARDLVALVADLCAQSPVPVYFYHPPNMNDRPIAIETIERLVKIPGLKGVKDSTTGEDHLRAWIRSGRDDFSVFLGNSRLFRKWAHEVTGGIMAVAGVTPTEWRTWSEKIAAGESVVEIESTIAGFEARLQKGGLPALKEMYEEASLFGGDPTPMRKFADS